MKKIDLKKLYSYDDKEKAFNIDINLDYYRDVYSEWDYSPIANRDLDEDLLDYLMSCSYEIPLKNKVIINFYLPANIKDENREKKSIIGIKNYFSYKIRKVYLKRFRMIKNTLIYLFVGIGLLLGAYMIQNIITNNFLLQVLPEGLLIGAWVLIWEIFSIWFFQVSKLGFKLKHYKRLKNSTIIYRYV
ncbi:hypothetical protein [Oceanirhabdus sp. W0125-5]|uniref:hypothetical protein n=1 Tax=Oceanirhabdus sp. W0125-5 TaxID=2999116 RepID=UPI0022F30074|nr:hypothetical protein [Oceanirhabdus sp. W0125-5]WBW97277.1 hypothetical protein OW730_00035 [Oceanirhabdus sp. W0125-5]